MSWHIHAWLEQGHPRLRICDARSETAVLDWTGDLARDGDPRGLHALFHDLILLSCRQDCANVRVFGLRLPDSHRA
jgi:hypothetical protein